MAWRMRRDEDTARDSDSPQAASRLGFLAVRGRRLGGVWACGSPAGSAPAYLFPDASLVDARPRVDATRSPLDAVSTSSDATAPAERGQSRCTPDGGTVTLSTRAFPFDYGIVVDPDAVYFFGLEADAGPQGQIDLVHAGEEHGRSACLGDPIESPFRTRGCTHPSTGTCRPRRATDRW